MEKSRVNVLIWGGGSAQSYSCNKRLQSWNLPVQVKGYLDMDPTKWTQSQTESLQEGAVMGSQDFMRFYKKNLIQKIVVPPTMGGREFTQALLYLARLDIDREDVVVPPICYLKGKQPSDISEVMVPWYRARQIEYLEVYVTDKCNLNCKRCAFFAPCVTDERFPFDENMDMLRQLRKYLDHINMIRIMGGEPLLEPRLNDYMDEIHNLFPYSDIRITTNGLLLTKRLPELEESIRRNHVTVVISLYPPLLDRIQEIIADLERRNIPYNIHNGEVFFSALDLSSKDTIEVKKAGCPASWHCYSIRNRRMFPCALGGHFDIAQKYFNLDILPETGLDLYDPELTTERIHKYLDDPIELCRVCSFKNKYHLWEPVRGDISLSDWDSSAS